MTDLNKAREVAQRLRDSKGYGANARREAANIIGDLIMEVIEWRLPENNGAWERAENKRLRKALETASLRLKVGMPEYDAFDVLEVIDLALKGTK